MNQWDALANDIRHMHQQKARHRQARHENMVQAGENLVFNTLLDCLPDGHPLQQEAVRDHIAYLGRQAHADGRTLGPIDPWVILSELKEKHCGAVRRAAEELEDQQPIERGVIFKHWELRVHREPMRLKVSTLGEAQAVRLRAAQLVRETKFNESVDAPSAVRRAMGER